MSSKTISIAIEAPSKPVEGRLILGASVCHKRPSRGLQRILEALREHQSLMVRIFFPKQARGHPQGG